MAFPASPLWGTQPFHLEEQPTGEFDLSDDSLESGEEDKVAQHSLSSGGCGRSVNIKTAKDKSNDSRATATTVAESRLQSHSNGREASTTMPKSQTKPSNLSQKGALTSGTNWADMPSPTRAAILKKLQESHEILQRKSKEDTSKQLRRERAAYSRSSMGSSVSHRTSSAKSSYSGPSRSRLDRKYLTETNSGVRTAVCPHGLRYRSLCCFCSSPDAKRDAAATGGLRLLQPTVASLMHSASRLVDKQNLFNQRASSAPAGGHTPLRSRSSASSVATKGTAVSRSKSAQVFERLWGDAMEKKRRNKAANPQAGIGPWGARLSDPGEALWVSALRKMSSGLPPESEARHPPQEEEPRKPPPSPRMRMEVSAPHPADTSSHSGRSQVVQLFVPAVRAQRSQPRVFTPRSAAARQKQQQQQQQQHGRIGEEQGSAASTATTPTKRHEEDLQQQQQKRHGTPVLRRTNSRGVAKSIENLVFTESATEQPQQAYQQHELWKQQTSLPAEQANVRYSPVAAASPQHQQPRIYLAYNQGLTLVSQQQNMQQPSAVPATSSAPFPGSTREVFRPRQWHPNLFKQPAVQHAQQLRNSQGRQPQHVLWQQTLHPQLQQQRVQQQGQQKVRQDFIRQQQFRQMQSLGMFSRNPMAVRQPLTPPLSNAAAVAGEAMPHGSSPFFHFPGRTTLLSR
ncbi:hypothetical protein cyc_05186 [Cyclospora cayetanensis]|uniref:Uncharacterized protein n=1 Tax=Cyclospora cayetanensis TaxID=88456 RepID=A0A1D3CVV9_9EIME|nr:hypothetical protein cyc_05186 [Cyclospora cayetanensis]